MRLIDAHAYAERIIAIMTCWRCSPCLTQNEAEQAIGYLQVALREIIEMPTAYDIEKVIEDIDKKSFDYYTQSGAAIDVGEIEEIIRRGGMD